MNAAMLAACFVSVCRGAIKEQNVGSTDCWSNTLYALLSDSAERNENAR